MPDFPDFAPLAFAEADRADLEDADDDAALLRDEVAPRPDVVEPRPDDVAPRPAALPARAVRADVAPRRAPLDAVEPAEPVDLLAPVDFAARPARFAPELLAVDAPLAPVPPVETDLAAGFELPLRVRDTPLPRADETP